ncbi:MAG TPA: SemiSWEET transporter [Rhizomicrobium sp.]|jgi:MtN3 and saliva related transmembrane protein
MFASLIGYTAAFCTTVALIPQVHKAWTTRSTADISMGWIAVLALGTFLWFVYGLMVGDGPLIAANGITCALSLTIVALKLRHG